LSKGDRDDVDSQVDHLLSKADQALSEAAQTVDTDTPEMHTALLAKVDQAIYQAGEMVEEANADASAEPQNDKASEQLLNQLHPKE
jgi:spore coat protein CotF